MKYAYGVDCKLYAGSEMKKLDAIDSTIANKIGSS